MPADDRATRYRFPALAENVGPARREAEAAARRCGVADVDAVTLAVSEAVTNAVVHAYRDGARGDIEVEAAREPRGDFVVTITDFGSGPAARTDSPGAGLGVPLMTAVSKRVSVTPGPEGGTQVRLWFAVG